MGRSMWEKKSDPNRYADRYAGIGDTMRDAQKSQFATDISDAYTAGTKLKKQAKLKGKYMALGGTQDEYDALIKAAQGGGGDTTSPIDSDDNPYTGYGPQEVATQTPSWMDKPTGKWDAYNQAMTAQWVQQQQDAENRKLGQEQLGIGLDDVNARLVETPAIGAQQIGQMTGAYESRLGLDEAAEMQRIKGDMARRGMTYDPNQGIGGALGGLAGLKRQMGAAQAGRDLDLYANQTNRSALERGLGMREGIRSGIANMGAGYAAQPYTMMGPGEYQTTQNPGMMQPDEPEWYELLLQGAGAAVR